MRFLTYSVVTETFIMYAFALISYFVAGMTKLLDIEMSGIISLLMCGIIQAHYGWYNLSPQGQKTTVVTFTFLGETAEAAVYAQVGISLFFTIPGLWSFSWIMVQMVIVIVGRLIAIIAVYYTSLQIFKKQTISFKELMFIAYGGMIRGAIAFALVMKIPYAGSHNCKDEALCFTKDQYELAVSTTLAVVMLTTLIFGTFMKVTSMALTGGV